MVASEFRKTLNRQVGIGFLVVLALAAFLSFYSLSSSQDESLSADEIRTSYIERTEKYIQLANRNLSKIRELSDNDAYAEEYYLQVAEKYANALQSVKINSGSAKGWDLLLRLDATFLLSAALSALIGALSVGEEKRLQSLSVLFSTWHGRAASGIVKTLVVAVLSVGSCLAVTVATILPFLAGGHLSDGNAAIQTASSFLNSPYALSLMQTFLLVTLQRCVGCITVGILFLFFSSLFSSYIFIFGSGIVSVVAEYVLFTISYKGVDVFAKNVNLFSFAGPYLYERYYSVRLFGSNDAFLTNILFLGILLPVLCALTVLSFSKSGYQNRRIRLRVFKVKRISTERTSSIENLTLWETKKQFWKLTVLVVVLFGFLLHCFVTANQFKISGNYSEQMYRSYCETLSKMELKDAKSFLAKERLRIESGKENYEGSYERLQNNEITSSEYDLIQQEYGYSIAHDDVCEECEDRLSHLESVSREHLDSGVRFVYDTPLNRMLESDIDIGLILALLLGLAEVFSLEYKRENMLVIRSTFNGRNKIFFAKMRASLFFAISVVLVFLPVNYIALGINGGLTSLSASVYSLSAAESISVGMSIGSYLLLLAVYKAIAYILFALLVVAISCITKRTFAAIVISGAFVFLPYVSKSVVSIPYAADLSSLMSGNRVLLHAPEFITALISLTLLTIIMAMIAFLGFSGRRKSPSHLRT